MTALATPPKAKAAKTTKPVDTETDDSVLKRSLQFDDGAFARLKASGADDEMILIAIRERWRKASVHGFRTYAVVTADPIWGTAIWYDSPKPTDDDPSLHYKKMKSGEPDGKLVAVVRELFQIPPVNGTAIVPQLKTSVQSTLLDARAEIPIETIDDSPFQTRAEPDAAAVESLAK